MKEFAMKIAIFFDFGVARASLEELAVIASVFSGINAAFNLSQTTT